MTSRRDDTDRRVAAARYEGDADQGTGFPRREDQEVDSIRRVLGIPDGYDPPPWTPLVPDCETCERLHRALERIARDADECPMEDMLGAGEIAREALR